MSRSLRRFQAEFADPKHVAGNIRLGPTGPITVEVFEARRGQYRARVLPTHVELPIQEAATYPTAQRRAARLYSRRLSDWQEQEPIRPVELPPADNLSLFAEEEPTSDELSTSDHL